MVFKPIRNEKNIFMEYKCYFYNYCMTDSASRKLKVNKYCVLIANSLKRASWAYLFRYDSPALFPQKKYNYGHIIN